MFCTYKIIYSTIYYINITIHGTAHKMADHLTYPAILSATDNIKIAQIKHVCAWATLLNLKVINTKRMKVDLAH